MSKTKTFQHDGRNYEVRITADENNTVLVRVFAEDGRPANGYSYSVDLLTRLDAATSGTINPVDVLVNVAISDVKGGTWERYVAAVEAADGTC